ncbi:putative amino acid transporter [Pseudohyphozyma bogoriensis]|nr:putative amino acid transporter [Pseudohyphozyma bogoriensis]
MIHRNPMTRSSTDEKAPEGDSPAVEVQDASSGDFGSAVTHMLNHRRLKSHQVQMSSVAGAIGAALFVGIGGGLASGGPIALIIAFIFWIGVVWSVAQCQIETVTLFPSDGSFIRNAGRMVDGAFGVAAGWNFFIMAASFVCFEATAFQTILNYWVTLNPAIMLTVLLVCFFLVNIWRADWFGEIEFWMSILKLTLAVLLFFYTFITMVGGNPLHDRFGFRYFTTPTPWVGENGIGKLEAWLAAVSTAGFVMAGPEYLSMTAGEVVNPRKTIPRAFNATVYRLLGIFLVSAFAVGILCPSDAPGLLGGGEYQAASPYVVSMTRLKIPVLPGVFNALLLTVVFSAGNSYTFSASRALHGLALDGQAPKIFRWTNRHGTPYLAVIATILISCISYMSLSAGGAKVLAWILNQTLNWVIMSTTWLRFDNAVKKQGIARESLPHRSRWQPYCGWFAFIFSNIFLWVNGYAVFKPGNWNTETFIFYYAIQFIFIAIFIGWKIVKRTRFYRGTEVDLQSDLAMYEAYELAYAEVEEAKALEGYSLRDKVLAKLF